MAKIKLFFVLIIFLLVVAVGYWVSTENTQLVSPVLFGFELPTWSLSTWLFIFLLSGSVLGYVVSLLSYLTLKAKVSSLQRKLTKREKEIAGYKTATVKE